MAGNFLKVKGYELPRWEQVGYLADPLRNFEVAVPELFRLVKRTTGRAIFVRASWFARSINQDGAKPDQYRNYEIFGNVRVSKREALRFLEGTYNRKISLRYAVASYTLVYARVTFSNDCFFIGG
jgi:hypothetical protein